VVAIDKVTAPGRSAAARQRGGAAPLSVECAPNTIVLL